MILPTSELYVLILLVASAIGWALWPNFFKASARWRFELFEYDLVWGFVIAAAVAAFTLGSWNTKELTFQDNFLLVGYRNLAWALGAGMVLSFATLALMSSVTISGMSVAFPISFAMAWTVMSVWAWILNPQISPTFSFGGVAVLLVAAALTVIATVWHLSALANETAAVVHADPRLTPTKSTAPNTGLGILFAILSGISLGIFFHALGQAGNNEFGLSPYGTVLLVAAGFFASAIVVVPFFLYFPVKGAALQVRHYFKGTVKHHILGVFGGIVLASSILAGRIGAGAPSAIQGGAVQSYLMGHSAPIVAVLLGLLVWKEFTGASTRVRAMLAASMVLLIGGMAVIALSPTYGK